MRTINLFELYAKIGLDTKDFENGIENASKQTTSFGDKLKKGLSTAAKAGAAALTAITTATTAISAAMIKGVSNIASYGDNIDKMSQKMGLSAEAYQEWDAIMQHSGTSIESLQASMKTLANAVENGNDAFERLGISQEEIAKMSNEELFSATITALQNVENETERTYLAGQLLGRGATELGALLNMSAEETEAMRKRVHELGGVMSDEAVKAAAAYQDSLQDMKTAISGVSRGILSEFLPSITSIMDGLTEIFAGNERSGIGQVTKGINKLIKNISSAVPKFLQVGTQIVSGLANAIIENLPNLLDTGFDIITTLIDGIKDEIPTLIDTGLEMLVLFMKGFTENIGTISEGIATFLSQISKSITDNKDRIIDSAGAFIMSFLEAIVNPDLWAGLADTVISIIDLIATAIETTDWAAVTESLINSIFEIITNIDWGQAVSTIFELIGAILGAGGQIIVTLANAIWSALKQAWDGTKEYFSKYIDEYGGDIGKGLLAGIGNAFINIGGWIKDHIFAPFIDGFKKAFGIDSETSEMFKQGQTMISQLGEGFQKAWESVKKFFTDAWDGIKEEWDKVAPYFSKIWEKIKQTFSVVQKIVGGYFSKAWEAIKLVWKAAEPFFLAIWENIKNIFSYVPKVLGEYFRGAWDAIIEVWDTVVDYFETLWESIKLIYSAVSDVLSGNFSEAWEKIKQVFSDWGDFFDRLWENLKQIFAGAWQTFTNIGSDIVNGLWQGIQNMWGAFTGWFSEKWDGLVDGVLDFLGIHSPSRVFADIGKNMALGLGEGWGKTFDKVSGDIQNGLDFTGDLAYNTYSGNMNDAYGMNGYQRGINVTQNIYSEAKTAADLMEEARWNFDMAVAY